MPPETGNMKLSSPHSCQVSKLLDEIKGDHISVDVLYLCFGIVFLALHRYSQRLGSCQTVKMVAHGTPRRTAQIWRFRLKHESMKMMIREPRAAGRRELRF